jgi:hypothetical protein
MTTTMTAPDFNIERNWTESLNMDKKVIAEDLRTES